MADSFIGILDVINTTQKKIKTLLSGEYHIPYVVATLADLTAASTPRALATPVLPVQGIDENGKVITKVYGDAPAARATFTRAAAQVVYTANTALLPAAGGLTEIPLAVRVTGGSAIIVKLSVKCNTKSITPRFRVHFFNAADPTIAADNAAWQEKWADVTKQLGYWDLPALTTAADATNSDMSRASDDSIRKQIQAVTGSTSIWVGLETLDGFTSPSGAAFEIKIATV
jgi:hypothetical protein